MLDLMNDISYKHNPRLVRTHDAFFIFHAEHVMNYSISTTCLASSGFYVYISLTRETGANTSLYGPLHWGENVVVFRTLNEIGIVDQIS